MLMGKTDGHSLQDTIERGAGMFEEWNVNEMQVEGCHGGHFIDATGIFCSLRLRDMRMSCAC